MFEDFTGDKFGFPMIVFSDIKLDFFAGTQGTPEVFLIPGRVVLDQAIGGVQDVGVAPIILLEGDDLSTGEVFFKIENVVEVGSPPRVDRLIGIADGKDVLMAGGEEFGKGVLRGIGVLVFIDEDK